MEESNLLLQDLQTIALNSFCHKGMNKHIAKHSIARDSIFINILLPLLNSMCF